MELYLQFGHGMMEHCRTLVRQWGGGTTILSPRDLNQEQISKLSKGLVAVGGRTLLDPQLYKPRSTHHRLTGHDYWPEEFETGMLLGGDELNHLLLKLKQLNAVAQTDMYIVPGLYCDMPDDTWAGIQAAILRAARTVLSDKPRYATVCLSSNVLRNEEQIEQILSLAEGWDVDGFYVVPEHPNTDYLVEDPMWMSNLLSLCSGLKLQGRTVVVGYSNHQMLCLAAANVDAIASGTFLNVRSFSTDKFQDPDGESTSRRATWYYCPQTLSEYKIAFLDMGHKAQVLDELKAHPSLGSNYADVLFSGAQPSTTDYSEQHSFRHFLQCVSGQARTLHHQSFRETMDAQKLMLERAEHLINKFHKLGIRGQDRDFLNYIDVNRSALDDLEKSRGFVLNRQW